MARSIRFLNIAEKELRDAVAYYNEQSEGLGYEFALEVKRTLQRIREYPQAWPEISKKSRRCRCNRFPYGVIYQIRSDCFLVIAVMHMHRKPDYWKTRDP